MKNIFLLSILVVLTTTIACNKDESIQPDCNSLLPAYGGIVDTSIFYFEWCEVKNATNYHIIVSESNNFDIIIYDTIVDENIVKSTLFIQDFPDTANIIEYSPFHWGKTYYWKVTPIIDDTEGDWSDLYTFTTWDARDEIIGTYQYEKRRFIQYSHHLATYDSIWSVGEIMVEKVPNTLGVRIKDLTNNDFDIEFEEEFFGYFWKDHYRDSQSKCSFKIDTDSFMVYQTQYEVPPYEGFLYTGRE